MGATGNRVYLERGTVGSNPTLSVLEGDAVPLFPRAEPAGTFTPCSLALGLASLGGRD